MERRVQAFEEAVVSVKASWGPVLEATVRFQKAVVVPTANCVPLKKSWLPEVILVPS